MRPQFTDQRRQNSHLFYSTAISAEKLYMAIIISQFLYYFSTKPCNHSNFGALFPTEDMNIRFFACIQIFAIVK